MKKILIIFTIIGLISCNQEDNINKPQYKTPQYTIEVNYINPGLGSIPPVDTITFESEATPHLHIKDGVSSLIGDYYYYPEASYVRSFKILSVK